MFINQTSFGKLPQGTHLERIKQSPNYNGKQFVNEIKTTMMTSEKGTLSVWKEYLFGDNSLTTFDTAISAIKTDLKSLPRDKDWIASRYARYRLSSHQPRSLGPSGLRNRQETGASRYMTVHHSKLCLSNHSYFEPLENAERATRESGKPVLMPKIGEVIYLD